MRPVPLGELVAVTRVVQAKPIYGRDQHPMVTVGGETLTSSPVYAVLALEACGEIPAAGARP